MPVDPDDLAVRALAGAPPAGDLDTTERAHFDALVRTVAVARAATAADVADEAPPADLWARISSSIADSGDATVSELRPGAPAPAGTGDSPGGEVVDLASRARNRHRVLAVAAAAVVVIGGLAALVAVQGGSDGGGQELVASADLALLAGGGSGDARLVRRDDGLHLLVQVDGLSPAEQADFYELWLLTPEGADPRSLEKFEISSGELDVVVPDDIDTASFPVVDISEEVDDGDESHSGLSILRGSLD
jgi:hypothetical protein